MKSLILLLAVIAIGGAAVVAFWQKAERHDPVEHYLGWGGYSHPVVLENKITKEEADVLLANGQVYLIGHFDGESRLTRVVKMEQGAVFFEYLYSYHANGRLKSSRVVRAGQETVIEYDERGRRVSSANVTF